MAGDRRIWVITSDLGYKMWDEVKQAYPDRFLNTGAAEQAMMGVAVGLALQGKVPLVYSITPFLLYRPFETIRNYVNHEIIPVKMIGSGRNKDYHQDGFSHWAEEDRQVMKTFSNIVSCWPKTTRELPALVNQMLVSPRPWYINLSKTI